MYTLHKKCIKMGTTDFPYTLFFSFFSRKLSDPGVCFTTVCWYHNIMSHNILRAHCVLDIYFLYVTFTTPPPVYLRPDWFHDPLKGFYTMREIRWKIIKNPEEWKSFKNVKIRNIFSLSRLTGIETALHFPSGQKLK